MTGEESDCEEKSPFFRLDPRVILDKVGVEVNGVERQEGERIDVPQQGHRSIEANRRNVGRLNRDSRPEQVVSGQRSSLP